MEKMSKYFIENGKNGEERLVLKNLNGNEIAAGRFDASKTLSRRKLKRISADAVNADIEMQIKDGYAKKNGTKFEVFKAANDKISFRLRESNGNVIISGGTYNELEDCLAAIKETRESLLEISYSNELTAIHKKPTFIKKKAVPRFSSMAEEHEQAEKRSIGTGFSVIMNEKQRPSFIMGRITDEKITSPQTAIRALNSMHYTMGFENSQQEFDEEDVEVRRQNDGTIFYRMKQYHNGIPVDGHTIIVSTDSDGNAETLSGQYAKISCDDDVKITEDQAKDIIEKKYGSVLSSEGLAYYVDDNEKSTLCWRFNTEEYQLYISTTSGETVNMDPNIISMDINTNKHVINTSGATIDVSIFNKDGGTPLKLFDAARNIEICNDEYKGKIFNHEVYVPTPFKADTESDADIAKMTERHAVTAYDIITKVYDYYRNVLGRNGADNKGKKIRIVMNDHNFEGDNNAAFYNGVESCTKIGISTNGNIERCLDILTHEFTHAVVNSTCNLIYRNQSGALNEAYADIMGELIEDGDIDYIMEDSDITPRRFDREVTMKDFISLKKGEVADENNDFGHVHRNSRVISHAAHLIQRDWITINRRNRYDLSALFYKSMEYLSPKSEFTDCYYALMEAALRMRVDLNYAYAKRKNIGAIADAFLSTMVFTPGSGNRTVNGRVTNSSDNEGVPGVTVEVYTAKPQKFVHRTITNSDGKYELKLNDNSKYILKFYRNDGYSCSIDTGIISAHNCGPWNFTSNNSITFAKDTFRICGHVMDPLTKKTIPGAIVKIVKGNHTESQVMTMKPDVVLKTDSYGYFSTLALPYGEYDIWAYTAIKHSEDCMTRIVHVKHNYDDPEYLLELEKKKRFYVSSLWVHWADKENDAKKRIKEGHTLIDVDLNKGTGKGAYIYIGYQLKNSGNPITNLLIYESDKAETWKTKTITHNGLKAVYNRIDVDLNKGAGGKYLYLCCTRDKQFRPLTKLDVLVQDEGDVRAPYWSGVRVVRNGISSIDAYADVNAKVKGSDDVFIMQTRKEIM